MESKKEKKKDREVRETLEELSEEAAAQDMNIVTVTLKREKLIPACRVFLDGEVVENMLHGDTTEIAIKTKLTVEAGPGASILFQVNDQVHERVKIEVGDSFTLAHLIEIVSPKIQEAFQSVGKELPEDVWSKEEEKPEARQN